jgi:hypothetical protein
MGKYFKLFLILLISLFLSNFFIKNFFLANSPNIKPNLSKYLAKKFFGQFNKQNETKQEIYSENSLIYNKIYNAFIPLKKGVYATDLDGGEYILINNDEVDWIEYTFYIKGKQIKIKVPNGEQRPPQEIIEKIYE